MRILLLFALLPVLAFAESWQVSDIRVNGLQRVSAGVVFGAIPAEAGDTLDEVSVQQLVRSLFRTGLFDDIRMARDGDVLVINVIERPAIDSITVDGNKSIPTENLLEGLADQGLAEGEIFKRATLERTELELTRQYLAQGRYGASIDATVTDLPRNRVAVSIQVYEGSTAGIRHINVVGNEEFSDAELLDMFELSLPGFMSFYTKNDKYAREKLAGDIEKLESYYQDRGYVNFTVASTQVSITPNKEEVYITLNVSEGEIYRIGDVDLVGELHDVPPEALRRMIGVRKGQVFSRAAVTATEERLIQVLGNNGYTFANATGIPEPREEGVVDVKFFVDSGKRVYVRRISFQGNTLTHDEVLRREMRQIEGGWASTSQIDFSKVRLERLGYFKAVNVETPQVPGTDDQVDVRYAVSEQPSGSISASLGFAQSSGLILGANYQENNVGGTGNSLGLGISWSQFQRSLNFNWFDPYFTVDGVSRGYSAFFRKTDFDEANIATFSTDAFGSSVNWGFPISETERLGFGFGFDHTNITAGVFPALEIREFLAQEGDTFLNFKLTGSWQSSSLNRGLFATAGISQNFSIELAVPGSDLQFYKAIYSAQMLIPVRRNFTLRMRTKLGYGDAYGQDDTLPFYEHFFAGGFGSVRGYDVNSLGPRTTNDPGDPFVDRFGDPYGG
ncbi:MAG: outer membrane protein assembly factor BamA, partial [Gammaproteobacteria bacterium]|nr:outer membrane protein assembly factor BamA [Gammaproteobacteria bacterium]